MVTDSAERALRNFHVDGVLGPEPANLCNILIYGSSPSSANPLVGINPNLICALLCCRSTEREKRSGFADVTRLGVSKKWKLGVARLIRRRRGWVHSLWRMLSMATPVMSRGITWLREIEFYVFKKFVRIMESLKVRNLSRLLHRHRCCSDFVQTQYLTSKFWVRLVISYGSLSSLLIVKLKIFIIISIDFYNLVG